MANNLRESLTFGFEQTFTTPDWWTEPGFTATSDTPMKREKMLDLAVKLAEELGGRYFESKDIWDHMQYEVTDETDETRFYVTMDPGSIEVKTPPCLASEVQVMAIPLFIAAEKAELVPYRNWWYGVQAGTEGGCHVNMGGFTPETNPLKSEPELVVKYAAYIHNRPWLHYPFMGIDVGPEGNAMRMDEKKEFKQVQEKFHEYTQLLIKGTKPDAQQTYDFFKDTNLINEKASFPSLYKFKQDLFFIEDRGQESLRCARDFFLVTELRMQILEHLQTQDTPEELLEFPNLHQEELTSFSLWNKFQTWAQSFDLPIDEYKQFFARQFPSLQAGENIPQNFMIKDGRRPRVIKDIQKRGDVIVSKTIDTRYKRFEIFSENKGDIEFEIEAEGIEFTSPRYTIDGVKFHYIDIKYNQEKPNIKITLSSNNKEVESAIFNIHNMMWE